MALDSLETRRLGREKFLDLVEENRSLLDGLLKHLATIVRDTNEQVRTALMFDVHGQVVRALITRSREDDGDRFIVRPKPTQDEIAQMIGRTRETVNRAIRELKKGNF